MAAQASSTEDDAFRLIGAGIFGLTLAQNDKSRIYKVARSDLESLHTDYKIYSPVSEAFRIHPVPGIRVQAPRQVAKHDDTGIFPTSPRLCQSTSIGS